MKKIEISAYEIAQRTVTPFLIGTSKISSIRFLILNIFGALSWAIIIGTMGYVFGHTFEILLGDIKQYELLVFGSLLLIGIIVWIYHFRKKTIVKKTFKRMR